MKIYSLYKHTFPNNKVYIGITSQKPERRWRNGKSYLFKNKNGVYQQPLIAHAILKYGWENIKHEILLETVNKDFIEQQERYYITDVYHSNDINFGYNIANGGNYRCLFSEETRKKMSEKKKGKPSYNKGKTFSEEARRHMSEAHLGKKIPREVVEKARLKRIGFKHSEESKKIMSIKAIGNKNSAGIKRSQQFIEKLRLRKLGTKHSDETKQKISEHKKGTHYWNNGEVERVCRECPGEGWVRGRLWKPFQKK